MDPLSYYDERKKELEADFNKKVANSLQKIFATVQEIQNDLNDIQKKFQETEQKRQAKEKELNAPKDDGKPDTAKGTK